MAYTKTIWENSPSTDTPIDETNLNKIENGIYENSTSWQTLNANFTYDSADAPTFVMIANDELTEVIPVGCKIKLTQSGIEKYFIVTKRETLSAGTTTIILYGGTDYVLANETISDVYYSLAKSPLGFPLDVDKWSVKLTSSTRYNQASPVSGTWYNLGGLKVDVPIGKWVASYNSCVLSNSSTNSVNMYVSLSTSSSSESNQEYTKLNAFVLGGVTSTSIISNMDNYGMNINLLSKTSYYLIEKVGFSLITTLDLRNDLSNCVINFRCAYL